MVTKHATAGSSTRYSTKNVPVEENKQNNIYYVHRSSTSTQRSRAIATYRPVVYHLVSVQRDNTTRNKAAVVHTYVHLKKKQKKGGLLCTPEYKEWQKSAQKGQKREETERKGCGATWVFFRFFSRRHILAPPPYGGVFLTFFLL